MSALTSELILKLKDDVSAKAKPIQAALDGIAKGEKAIGDASSNMKKLVSELEKSKNGLNALDRLKIGMKGLSDTRSAFGSAQDNVRKLAVEIANTDKPTRAMTAAFKAAQREVKTASEAMKAQIAATKEAKSALAGFDVALTTVSSAEAKLKSSIEQTVQALKRQTEAELAAAKAAQVSAQRRAEATRAAKEAAKAALGYGSMILGGNVVHATEKAVENAAEYAEQRNRVYNVSGKNDAETASADRLAGSVASQFPIVTRTRALEDYMELRSLSATESGGINAAQLAKNVTLMGKARTAAAAIGMQLSDGDARNLAMAIEGSGRASDPRAQEMMLDAYLRAKQVYGSAIDASKIRDFVANAKAANFPMNDQAFYYTTMARLAQGNASRLGTEFSSTMKTLVGGSMTKQGAEWLASVGLINQNQIQDMHGGKFRINGAIKGADLLSSDQTSWAQQYLLPAMEHSGILSDAKIAARARAMKAAELKANPNAVIDEQVMRERAVHGLIADSLQKTGFKSTVPDNLIHAIANEVLIMKDIAQMKITTGLEAAGTIGRNPVAAFQELSNAIANLGAVAADPAVSKVSSYLDGMAKSIGSFSEGLDAIQKRHPTLAAMFSGAAVTTGLVGGTGLAIGGGKAIWDALSSGFGLKGSAVALSESAALLSSAATRLGAEGAVGSALSSPAAKRGLLSRAGGWLTGLLGPLGVGIATWQALDAIKTPGGISLSDAVKPENMQKAFKGNPGDMGPSGMWGPRWATGADTAIRRSGPIGSEDMVPSIKPGGTEAGVQTGQNIAEGLASQAGAIEAAAERIMSAITAKLSKGVDVPIRLQQQGASTVTGTHGDYGIDYTYGD